MKVVVRHANLADRGIASAIQKEAFPDDPHHYANNIGLHGTINLMAESDGRVVGFISVLVNHSDPHGKALWQRMRPYVGFVAVSEESRRTGAGRALVIQASQMAMAVTGKTFIYLECDEDNERGHLFFEELGFKVVESDEIERTFGRPTHPGSRVYRLNTA